MDITAPVIPSGLVSQTPKLREDELLEALTPAEFAAIFRVDPKTVNRWAAAGRVRPDQFFKTPGGHRRFLLSAAHEILRENGITDAAERTRIINAAKESARE